MTFEHNIDAYFSSFPQTDELLFDGFDSVCVVRGDEKTYQETRSVLHTFSIDQLQDFALGQGVRWDPLQPAAGGSFCVGSESERHYRWHGLLPPVARDGLLLSVRRHRLGEFALSDFVAPSNLETFLRHARSHRPVFVMGPTGAGKTSFMISALLECAADERLAILEQLPEVPKLSPRWIRLCAQPANFSGEGAVGLEYLIDELLRLRPDRMVIGELRREEIFAFKRALLAGHASVWTTVHAARAEELPWRLAELGAASRAEWDELLVSHNALVVVLSRQTPRFQGLWQFTQSGLISCF
ncbi:MAG: Flp pilus assembly complex ATPase component TadA [Chitinophagaceae bacterium]|nr:Flp pilus assembly complex ATPase component TadA [Oligoflexus sp.]